MTPVFPNDVYTTKLTNLETFTGRFGYAPGNWLLYGKAGIASGSVALNVLSGVPVPGVAYSSTVREFGPTGGVGLEYMWAPHFVVGVEYDYAVLNSVSINTTTTGAAVGLPVPINGAAFRIQTLVGRLSYKF